MEISSSVQTVLRAPDAPIQKKVDSTSPSFCSRIFSAVKYALATFVYFVTFCQVDLRGKKAIFAKQSDFHALTSLPKKSNDLENQVHRAFYSVLKRDTDWHTSFLRESKVNLKFPRIMLGVTWEKALHQAIAKEFAQILTFTFNSGQLSPVEWKISLEQDELSKQVVRLTLYAPEDSDIAKLPTPTTNPKHKDAIVVSSQWKRTTVALEQVDIKQKPASINCLTRTIDLTICKLHVLDEQSADEMLKHITEESTQFKNSATMQEALESNFEGANPDIADRVRTLKEKISNSKARIAELVDDKEQICRELKSNLDDMKELQRIYLLYQGQKASEAAKTNRTNALTPPAPAIAMESQQLDCEQEAPAPAIAMDTQQLHCEQEASGQAGAMADLGPPCEQEEEVLSELNKICSGNTSKVIASRDIHIIAMLLSLLRSTSSLENLNPSLLGKPSVNGDQINPHGSHAILYILFKADPTEEQLITIQEIIDAEFKKNSFTPNTVVYNYEDGFSVRKFSDQAHYCIPIILAQEALRPEIYIPIRAKHRQPQKIRIAQTN